MALEKKSPFFKFVFVGTGILFLGFLFRGNPTVRSVDDVRKGEVTKKTYFWMGEKMREELDSNQDGLVDIWRVFREGKAAELRIDRNFDRRPDIWGRYGEDGKISTVQADTDFDGKTDFAGGYYFRPKK